MGEERKKKPLIPNLGNLEWSLPNWQWSLPSVREHLPNWTGSIPNVTHNVGTLLPNETRHIPNMEWHLPNMGGSAAPAPPAAQEPEEAPAEDSRTEALRSMAVTPRAISPVADPRFSSDAADVQRAREEFTASADEAQKAKLNRQQAIRDEAAAKRAEILSKLGRQNAPAQNMAASALQTLPPSAGPLGGSISPDAVRARALGDYNRFGNGGVILKQPPVAGSGDPNADTPEDIARKAALSRMVLSGSREGSVVSVPGQQVPFDNPERASLQSKFIANAQRRAHDAQRARDMAEEAATPEGMAAAAAVAERKKAALDAFNKKNAERAYARGSLTPGAYANAVNNGYLPKPDGGGNSSQVAHLEGIYGRGNVPEHAYVAAMHEDAETQRRQHEAPDKAAIAGMMRVRALNELNQLFPPKVDEQGNVTHHPLVQAEISKMMPGGSPASPAKPPMSMKKRINNKVRDTAVNYGISPIYGIYNDLMDHYYPEQ